MSGLEVGILIALISFGVTCLAAALILLWLGWMDERDGH